MIRWAALRHLQACHGALLFRQSQRGPAAGIASAVAPPAMRRFTVASRPARAARINGVVPSTLDAFGSAPAINSKVHDLGIAGARRIMQRREAVGGPGVDLGAARDKQLGRSRIVAVRGSHRRRRAIARACVNVNALVEQSFDTEDVPVRRRKANCRPVPPATSVGPQSPRLQETPAACSLQAPSRQAAAASRPRVSGERGAAGEQRWARDNSRIGKAGIPLAAPIISADAHAVYSIGSRCSVQFRGSPPYCANALERSP